MMAGYAVPHRIVIVGGGQAGVSAARELRLRGHRGVITLVDAGEFPCDRPPLSKSFLLGESDEDAIRLVPEGWFDEQDVTLRSGRRVVALQPDTATVRLDDGTDLRADAVLLATGGEARRLPVPGGDLAGVHVLRTVVDARCLRAALVPGARAVVVGGGLIGAEVASSARRLGCEVTLVEPVDVPLLDALGPEIATFLHGQHSAAGIRVVADAVASIVADGSVLRVTVGRGWSVPADVVVVGIGMSTPDGLARDAGIATGAGVVVDRAHRTSNPAVFAAGDAARVRRPDGVLHRAEHWQAAKQSGAAAAAAILGQEPPGAEPEWFWSDRHGVHAEAVGSMVGTRRLVRGEPGGTPLTVFNLDGRGRVVGAAAIDAPTVVAAARRLIRSGAVPDPDVLVDVAVDPRRLVRPVPARR